MVRGFRALGIVWDAVRLRYPITFKGPVKHCDPAQGLDPVGCIPAGDYQAKWKSIQHGKRLSIHLVGDHRVLLARTIDRQRLHHIRDRGERRLIKAVERDVDRSGADAGGVQQITQPNSGPQRVAHGSVPPLSARHAWLEQAARVARALGDGDDRHRLEAPPQIVQGE